MPNSPKHAPQIATPRPVAIPLTYRPPIENICAWCGGKHVGSCDKNACSDVGRIGAA